MQKEHEAPKVAETTDNQEYEAPAIEKVMTAEDLTREVHYAGITDTTNPPA
jgi:hypothetical protein